MDSTAPLTAEELLSMNIPNKRTELVRGVLVVREPAGYRHGFLAARLAQLMMNHAYAHRLGLVFGAETGFTLARTPDTVRAPDVAYIRRDRLPDPMPTGFAEIAPDLAVEVLSPDDRPGEVLAKVADWLTAGSLAVWVVDPRQKQVRAYRHDGGEALAEENQVLQGEDILPGFACPVSDIFATP